MAILTVDDEEFWEGASPLALGELPELTDDVSVIGYVMPIFCCDSKVCVTFWYLVDFSIFVFSCPSGF